jgi:hypothetical protein
VTASDRPWLPPPAVVDADDDPWGDVDVPEVTLTPAQHDFLSSFAEQPALPRLRRPAEPVVSFDEP